METTRLQVQAVLYNTDFDAVYRSCESIANALKHAQDKEGIFTQATFTYGDASPEPAFTEDQVAKLCACFAPAGELTYTFFNENTGFGGGHNRMSESCTDGWLLIINPDIVVGPSFFHYITKPLADNSVGIVEARQTPIEHPKDYNPETGDTSWSSGACMLIDAALYAQLNGFDTETFYMYCEDVDLSWRVRMQGRRVVYQPCAPAFHPKRLSPDARWAPSESEVLHSALSNLMMAYKWSNDERLEALQAQYREGDNPAWNKALAAFEEKQANGTLPERIDADHSVATFEGTEYAVHRFGL